LKITEID